MNRRRFSGRLLAAMLCIVLVMTMIPVFASAAMKAPKMKEVKNVEKGVSIRWKSVSGAEAYRVFRKPARKGSWKAIAEVTGTTYIDKSANNGVTYFYAVGAVKGGEHKGGYSANPMKITVYKAPVMLDPKVQKNGILVQWKKVKGAPLYRIERSKNGGKWKKIATTKTTSYLDKKVSYNQEYRYRVRVVSKDKKTKLSEVDTTLTSVLFTRVAEISSLKNRNGNILVKWDKIKGASKYRLLRKVAQGDWKQVYNGTNTSFTDNDVVNNVLYTYQVRALDAAGDVIGIYHPGKSITYYVTPTFTADGISRSGGNLVTKWYAVEGISNYVIYRRTNSAGEWIKIGTSTTTTFSDSSMPSGTYCEYTIACADSSGNAVSTYGVNIVGIMSYKEKPILKTISNGNGSVTITWQSVDLAAGYEILRKVGGANPLFVPIATVGAAVTTYTDTGVTNCGKYTYSVRCIDGTDTESLYDTTGLTITYYDPPALKAVSNELAGAKIKWSKVDGVANYKIWRKTGASAWTVIATVNGANAGYVYTDTSVVNTGHYCYSVSCSANSESTFITPGLQTTFYAAPVINPVKPGDGFLTVDWNAVAGITGYRVQRKVGGGSWTNVGDQTTRTYKDTNANVSGKKYTYRICSLSGSTKVSAWRTTTAWTYLDKPIIKSVTGGKGQVTIKWDHAVVGASSYDVYYMEYPGGEWKKAASAVPVAKNCVVKNLISGQVYAFKLVAVKGTSRSVDSNTKRATAK